VNLTPLLKLEAAIKLARQQHAQHTSSIDSIAGLCRADNNALTPAELDTKPNVLTAGLTSSSPGGFEASAGTFTDSEWNGLRDDLHLNDGQPHEQLMLSLEASLKVR